MPLSQLAVFLAEIEPLEAAESLRLLNVMRLSQSDEKLAEARMIIRSWENRARRLGRVEEPEEAKPSEAEYFAMLRHMGLHRT